MYYVTPAETNRPQHRVLIVLFLFSLGKGFSALREMEKTALFVYKKLGDSLVIVGSRNGILNKKHSTVHF
jgi:hypothetical protein